MRDKRTFLRSVPPADPQARERSSVLRWQPTEKSAVAEHARGAPEAPPGVFAFDDFEVDPALLELRRGGVVVPLEPKPFQLLLLLIRNRDRVVSRAELARELWPGVHVTKSSIATALYEMRRALGDTGSEQGWIATARGRGYRFAGRVEERRSVRPAAEPTPPLETPLSQRAAELEQLHAVLGAARAGAARIVLLHGPPGIGKTRTALELARSAATLGFEVQLGRAHEGEGAPPFWPWIQVLRGALFARGDADLRQSVAGDGALLAQLVPELRERLPLDPRAAAGVAGGGRCQLFDAVSRRHVRAATATPLLVILEDLHWADESSLALLHFVAQNARRAPLAVVGTHRDLAASSPGPARALGRVLREQGSSALALASFTPETVQRILDQALGQRADALLMERVHAVTGGNPFFVTELARLLAARAETTLDSAQIPLRLHDAVRLRIAECSEPCRKLLLAACAIGPEFELSTLWRVLRSDAEAALEALDEAERRHLLMRGPARGSYRFAHAVVRETLHEQLATAERMRLHRDIALALESSEGAAGARLAELAHHFAEATPLASPERAIHYARAAAEHASSVSAHGEAVTHYRRALRAVDYCEPPVLELRCALLVELGEALAAAHEPIEAVEEAFSHAIQLAERLSLPRLLARAAAGSTAYALGKDTLPFLRPHRAGRLLERMAPHVERTAGMLVDVEDAPLRARTLLALGSLHDSAGHAPLARALISTALPLVDAERDPALRAEALLRQWSAAPTLDRVEERRGLAREALALARRAGRRDLEVIAQIELVFHALESGDRAALDAAGRAIESVAEARVPEAIGAAHAWRCLAAQLDARLDAAERAMAEGAEFGSRINYSLPRTAVTQAVQEWWLALLRGRAQAIAPKWEGFASFDPSLLPVRLLLARLHAETDPTAGAEPRDLLGMLQQLTRDDQWLFCASVAAELCARRADRESAEALLELLAPYAERSISAGWILICTGSVARPLAELAAVLQRWSESIELFELAFDHAHALRSPLLQALTRQASERALARAPREDVRRRARLADARPREAVPGS